MNKIKNIKDLDIDDEYAAWGWEQAEKQNELDWYESQEDFTYDEETGKKKLYETERTRNLELEI